MSYTKLSKEATKWLKENNLPWKGKSSDTKEETEIRLEAWKTGVNHVFQLWLEEKRFKELISCAHSGWLGEEVFYTPLTQYFVAHNDLNCLQVLWEKELRSSIEGTLSLMNYAEEDGILSFKQIQSVDVNHYENSKQYDSLKEIAKWQHKTVAIFNQYITYLEQLKLEQIEEGFLYYEVLCTLRDKVKALTIKKKDLKVIKNKLPSLK